MQTRGTNASSPPNSLLNKWSLPTEIVPFHYKLYVRAEEIALDVIKSDFGDLLSLLGGRLLKGSGDVF